MLVSLVLASLLGGAPPSQKLNCVGNRVAPPGYEMRSSVVPSGPGAVAVAESEATRKLIEGICQGLPCQAIAAEALVYKTGENDGYACAMAVIETAAVQRWRSSLTTRDLDLQLEHVAKQLLLDDLPHDGKKVSVAVVLHKVVDNNTPGGERAEWLRTRMGTVLSRFGDLSLKSPPPSWAGDGVPKGFNAVLTGRVFTLREGHTELLEVSWNARLSTRPGVVSEKYSSPVRVPLAVLPSSLSEPPATDQLPAPDPELSLQLESAPGGSLCVGQPTQLHLRSARGGHVQVYNVYGKSPRKALLVFPNEQQPRGLLKAGETVRIGGDCGFQAFPLEGADNEHFIALSAESASQLGPLAGLKGYCRLRDPERIIRGAGLPKTVRRAGDGYRLTRGKGCGTPPPPKAGCEYQPPSLAPEEIQAELEKLPWCEGAAAVSKTAEP